MSKFRSLFSLFLALVAILFSGAESLECAILREGIMRNIRVKERKDVNGRFLFYFYLWRPFCSEE